MRRLAFEESSSELVGIDRSQALETLAYPDQLRGQLKLFGNRKRDAGLELGDAEHVDGIAEELGLT